MRFANPAAWLLAWIFIPLLIVMIYAEMKQQKNLQHLASKKLWKHIFPGFKVSQVRLMRVLQFLGLFFLFVALTKPQWGFEWVQIQDRGSDLMVVVDVSESMQASDYPPSRMVQAKRELLDLLDVLQGERLGLVAFSGVSHLLCPLTSDYGAFSIFLDYLDADLIPVPGTDLYAGLSKALEGFSEESSRHRSILLITDGENHGKSLDDVLEKAKSSNTEIYVVGIGSSEGAPIPLPDGRGFQKDSGGKIILSKLDESSLRQIAKQTNGLYVRAVAGDLDLQTIYQGGISKYLSKGEDSDSRRKRYKERYQLFLLLGLVAFVLSMTLPYRRQRLKGETFNKVAMILIALSILLFLPPAMAGPLEKGVTDYHNKNYDSALNHFLEGQVESKQADPRIHFNSGAAFYRLERFDEATKEFRQALETEDMFLKEDVHYSLGNSLLKQGRPEEAIEQYERALAIEPNDEEAKHNLEMAKLMLQQQKQQSQQNDGEQDKDNQTKNEEGDRQQQNNKPSDAESADNNKSQTAEQPSNNSEQQQDSLPQESTAEFNEEVSEEEARQWLSKVKEDGKESIRRTLMMRYGDQAKTGETW